MVNITQYGLLCEIRLHEKADLKTNSDLAMNANAVIKVSPLIREEVELYCIGKPWNQTILEKIYIQSVESAYANHTFEKFDLSQILNIMINAVVGIATVGLPVLSKLSENILSGLE